MDKSRIIQILKDNATLVHLKSGLSLDFISALSFDKVADEIIELESKPYDYSICVKCGSKYIQHLFKPLTICDKCSDKLSEEIKNFKTK
jgi:hypothetical protein